MTFYDGIAAVWHAVKFWDLSIVAIFALFCVVVRRLNDLNDNKFFFHDFFTSGDWNGKASVSRLGYFAAFLVHSLVVLHQEMQQGAGIDAPTISMYALIWSGAYVALKAIELRTATPQTTGGNDGTQQRQAGTTGTTP